MAFGEGGKREGAGRPKGAKNTRSRLVDDILEAIGCDPLTILAEIAMGQETRGAIKLEDGQQVAANMYPTLDQRIVAAKEICGYAYSKKRAVELTGKDGEQLTTFTLLIGDPVGGKEV